MRNRALLLISLVWLLRWSSNCTALEPKDIQELPRPTVEQALPSANPSDYYVYASRLLHEGDQEAAAFWYYVGEIRYRFYLAANPNLSPSGSPALFSSLHESVGSVVSKWARANLAAATNQLQRALNWDASTDNPVTSKSLHAKEWGLVRAEIVESERAENTGAGHVSDQSRPTVVDVSPKGVDAALYRAVGRASRNEVERLLEQGANPNVVFARDGTSAVSLAAKQEDPWFLREILGHGGDMNLRNPLNGRTPLVEAMASGRHGNAQTLIAAGADLNTRDSIGLTPLLGAAMNQKYELVYDMLVAGADPTMKMGRSEKSLLWVVRKHPLPSDAPAYQWQMKVIDLLKQRGLDVEHGE